MYSMAACHYALIWIESRQGCKTKGNQPLMSNLCEVEIGENEEGNLLGAQMGSRAAFKDIRAAFE